MHLICVVALVLVGVVVSTPTLEKRGGQIAESQTLPRYLQNYIVKKHNKLRGKANPRATNMKTIRWDDELARTATNWARCQNWFQHSNDWSYGENLYVSYNYEMEDAVRSAMKLWWDEGEDFDYYRNECDWGKVCGHYTQMAWADTYAIGCGYARNCPGEAMDFYLVCNYKAPGNMMGEKPYSVA